MIKVFSTRRSTNRVDGGGVQRFISGVIAFLVMAMFIGVTRAGVGTSSSTQTIPSVWNYIVIDLGYSQGEGAPNLLPIAINNSSTVLLNGDAPSYLWTNGALTAIPYSANSMNNNGDVLTSAGFFKNGALVPFPQYNLPGPPADSFGGYCINDNRDIGGSYNLTNNSATALERNKLCFSTRTSRSM